MLKNNSFINKSSKYVTYYEYFIDKITITLVIFTLCFFLNLAPLLKFTFIPGGFRLAILGATLYCLY